MNQRDILRRQTLDYPVKAREALIHVKEAIRKKDFQVNFSQNFKYFFKTILFRFQNNFSMK